MSEDTTDNTTTIVNNAKRTQAMLALIAAYAPMDIDVAAKMAAVSREDMCSSLPEALAEQVSDTVYNGLLVDGNIGNLVSNLVQSIYEIVGVIAGFTGDVESRDVNNVVLAIGDFLGTPGGSAGEVLAQRKLDSAINEINETVLRRNGPLYVAFENPESGYSMSLGRSLFADEDEDDDNEEASEQPPVVNRPHG